MPLSNEEQKMLDELEASLRAEDPRLARTMGTPAKRRPPTRSRRKAGLAGLGFVMGLALLLIGMQTVWVVSVVGFVAMFSSAVLALNAWSGSSARTRTDSRRKPVQGKPISSDPFTTRMEDRWRRRQDEGRL